MMHRVPIFGTMVVLALAGMLAGLGIWQLKRAAWKADLLARLEAAPGLPLLEPRDFLDSTLGLKSVQYRRAQHICRPGTVRPYDLKGGASRGGQGGFLVLVSCRPPATQASKPPDIVVVAGWTRRPDAMSLSYTVDMMFEGLVIERPYGDALDDKGQRRPGFMLIPTTAIPGLEPSQLPSARDMPDNHLAYAGQWFGLAGALLAIYGLWLRRRLKVAPSVQRG